MSMSMYFYIHTHTGKGSAKSYKIHIDKTNRKFVQEVNTQEARANEIHLPAWLDSKYKLIKLFLLRKEEGKAND